MSAGDTFAALRERNYRIYFSGGVASNVGTWMQRVAQDWLVLELSGGSAIALGLTTALQFLPTLVLSAYGGVLADRFDKRRLLMITQSWMAVSAALLGVLALTGNATVTLVYVIAFAFGLGSAFDTPARQAMVPEVVSPERLTNAIGLNSASFNTARLIGPAVAGLVIHQWGSGVAILVNAVSYLSFIAGICLLDRDRLATTPRTPRGPGQLREGLAYVRGRPDLMLIMVVIFFLGTFGLNNQLTSALMASQEFGKGAQEYGILGSVLAIGSLTGALLGARRRSVPRLRFVVTTGICFGVIEIAAGFMPSYLTYAMIMPLMGLTAILTMNAANAFVQLQTDPRLRGRVMALYLTLVMGGTPIGAPMIGWIGDVLGPRWTLWISGGLTLVGIAVAAAVLLRRKQLVVSPMLHPRPHMDIRPRATSGQAADI